MEVNKYHEPTDPTVDTSELTEIILDDLFRDFKDNRWWVRTILEPIARPGTIRFARIMGNLDYMTAKQSFHAAMTHTAEELTKAISRFGTDRIPRKGPLLLVANHPGTCDSMVIVSSLPRTDLKIIATGFPLLRNLPNANQHLIFIPQFGGGFSANISVVREAIRHLETGGSVLNFPSGRIDPDPAVLPGAMESINSWSPSLELIIRKVPQVQIQFAMVSGVLAPFFLRNPLNSRLSSARNPQAIAEAFQILCQMLFERWVQLKPSISFSMPKSLEELRRNNMNLYQSILTEASRLLSDHMQTNIQP